eukprot:s1168_g12.t1
MRISPLAMSSPSSPRFRGLLQAKCSVEEATIRQEQRLLDPLEMRRGCDLRNPEVDFSLATKKYQRSSAGKTFEPSEVRSPETCLETMTFLMDSVLEADLHSEAFAITPSFMQIYSYLHDRCRAVRVDLHLQQPWSSQTAAFVTCHEYSLRFEVLSRFLFAKDAKNSSGGYSSGNDGSYDEHLGLQAISQTIDPLLAAYRDARLAGEPFETEAEIQRLVILLLLVTSPNLLPSHLAAMDRELLRDPLILGAVNACADFLSDDYARFLRYVASEGHLVACVLTDLADLARLRLLWLRARAYPKAVGDRWPLKPLAKLLSCDMEVLQWLLTTYDVDLDDERLEAVLPRKDAWANHPLCCELPREIRKVEGKDSNCPIPRKLPSRSELVKGQWQKLSKYKRTASSKFVEGRKPKEWKQICLPWSDTWEESAAGIIRKEGISIAMESDRFEVLNRKGVPFSMRDKRLQAASGRRLVLQSDFPMLLNIKVWTIAELQRRLREPDKELCQSQAAIQKQIEQLERGRPGKLLEPHEKLKLERLRQDEAELKVRSQESRAVLEGILRSRATVMLQAIVRGCGTRRRQRHRREAAKVLQRGWRGYLSRVRLENLKALARQRVKQVKHVRNAESLFEAVKDLQEAIAIRVVKDKDFNPFIFRHAVSQQSLLHAAAQEGLHEGLHVLCHELLSAAKQRGMDSFVVARDWRGWTALHTAAKSGQVECCKELLTAEELTEPPGSLGRNGQTALHVAALQGHTEVVKVLLAAQSFEEEVDRRDRWGRTALHLAVEQNHLAAAVSLAEHNSFNGFDAKSAWGQSALDLATSETKEALQAAHQRKLGALPGRRRNLVVATKDQALKGDAAE